MEEEIVVPQITDPVLPPLPTAEPKKNKPLKLLAVFAVMLVVFAVGLSMLGGGKKNVVSDTSMPNDEKLADNVYQNKEYFYQLTLPPKWSAVTLSANDNATAMFTTSGAAMLSVSAVRQQGSLEAFLGLGDEEGGISIKKSSPIKVGRYDAMERYENWSDQGVEVIGAYVKIQDMIYSFNLLPTGEKNAVTNESLLREYRSVLASFRLTDTTNLGKEGVIYKWNGWSISYPQNWKLNEKANEGGFVIYRDNYEIIFAKTNVAPAVCLFSDSAELSGYAGDLRDKEFVEVEAEWSGGLVMRRYFKGLSNGKTIMYFCSKSVDQEQFVSPLLFGTLTYSVPPQYDKDILLEMDNIVGTISPLNIGD